MNYRIRRGDQEFGPYSLADLKGYIAEGRVVPTDLARSEGMEEWAPVARVIGDMEVPAPAATPGILPPPDATPEYAELILPPNLRWGFLPLLDTVTLGIFNVVWMMVQAVWVRKIDSGSIALYLHAVYAVSYAIVWGTAFAGAEQAEANATAINIIGGIVGLFGHFNIKNSLEEYYGGPPIHLDLSGIFTFFLNTIYFQYHFTRIHKWRRTGVLPG